MTHAPLQFSCHRRAERATDRLERNKAIRANWTNQQGTNLKHRQKYIFEEEEEVGNLAATSPTSARKSVPLARNGFSLKKFLAYAIKWSNERVSHRVNRVAHDAPRFTLIEKVERIHGRDAE